MAELLEGKEKHRRNYGRRVVESLSKAGRLWAWRPGFKGMVQTWQSKYKLSWVTEGAF